MRRFEDKVILITGGTSGMGLDTARRLLLEGGIVVITGRRQGTLDAARETLRDVLAEEGNEDRLIALTSDAAELRDIDRLMSIVSTRVGRLDGLFANAGIGIFKPADELTEQDFEQLVNINFKGLFFGVQRALPLLVDGGSIVLNASWTAHRGMLGAHLYSATKAAVLSLARTLANELASRRIRVNSVSPGYIHTPIVDKIGMREDDVDARAGEVPLGRWGTGEEIANVVAFLLSDESSYISGQDLLIDGGLVGAHQSARP